MKIISALFLSAFIMPFIIYGQSRETRNFEKSFRPEIIKIKNHKPEAQLLPIPKIREGLAEVEIYFDGLSAEPTKLQLLYNNPITDEHLNVQMTLDSKGYAKGIIPVISETQVLLFGYKKSDLSIFIAPGQKTTVYIDVTKDDGIDVNFGGYFKEINEAYHRFHLHNFCKNTLNIAEFYQLVSMNNMTSKAISNLIVAQLEKGFSELDTNANLDEGTKKLVKTNLKMAAANLLLSANTIIENERKNNPEIESPVFDLDYYLTLQKLELNDYYNLYSYTTANNLSLLKNLPNELLHRYIVQRYLSKRNIDQIKRDNHLSNVELSYLSLLHKRNPANWDLSTKSKLDTLASRTTEWLKKQEKLPARAKILLRDMESYKPGDGSYQMLLDQLISLGYTMAQESNLMPDFGIQLLTTSSLDTLPEGVMRNFNERFGENMKSYFNSQDADELDHILSNLLGYNRGFVFDLTRSQIFSKKLTKQFTSLDKYDLVALKRIKNKSVLSYLLSRNEQVLMNKQDSKTIFKIYEIPKSISDPDLILQNIRALFKKKAVFFDFWATWCTPCLKAMEEMETHNSLTPKDNFECVYVTDQSSATKTWNNMVSRIGGNHIKLTLEQSEALKMKFGFSGIPAYLLIDKNGKVLYSHTGFEGPQKIKALLNSLK